MDLNTYLTISSLIIAILGFSATIYQAKKSRDAAKNAEESSAAAKTASEGAKQEIRKHQIVADLSEAVRLMEEIKRLHRTRRWYLLPDRYEDLRKLLISIKKTNVNLTEKDDKAIQGTIVRINTIERQIDRTLAGGADTHDVEKLNATISRQSEKIYGLLVQAIR